MLRTLKENRLGKIIPKEQFVSASSSCWESLSIREIGFDSRCVQPGDVFFALPGSVNRGSDFIAQAVARGAIAVILDAWETYDNWLGGDGLGADLPGESRKSCILILVKDSLRTLALASKSAWRHPDRELGIIGITGTNGKTSIAWILTEALARLDPNGAGYLGTLGNRFLRISKAQDQISDSKSGVGLGDSFDLWDETKNTTPDSCTFYSFLDEARDMGVRWIAAEISSHALAQKRVDGVALDIAVITNLTRDHLDYHGTMAQYGESKAALFSVVLSESTKTSRFGVFNLEDGFCSSLYRRFAEQTQIGVHAKSFAEEKECADVFLCSSDLSVLSTKLRVSFGGEVVDITSQLVGRYNVSNLLAALCALWSLGFSPEQLAEVLPAVPPVPGRMQIVELGKAMAVIDYAHTPDALQRVHDVIRDLRPKRIITVFGCGGARDRGKRPLMGEVVARSADYLVVTSDNPRNERPEDIIAEILGGISGHGQASGIESNWVVIPDRREAIERALSIAGDGDVVLIAGKGNEDYQEIDGVRHHFSDLEVVKAWNSQKR